MSSLISRPISSCAFGDAIDFEDLRFQDLLPGEGQQSDA